MMNKKFIAISMLMFASNSAFSMVGSHTAKAKPVTSSTQETSGNHISSSSGYLKSISKVPEAAYKYAQEAGKTVGSAFRSGYETVAESFGYGKKTTNKNDLSNEGYETVAESTLFDKHKGERLISDNKPKIVLHNEPVNKSIPKENVKSAKESLEFEAPLTKNSRPEKPKIDSTSTDGKIYRKFLTEKSFSELGSYLTGKELSDGYTSRSQVITDVMNKMLISMNVPESILTSPRFVTRQFTAIKNQFTGEAEAATSETNSLSRATKISNAMSAMYQRLSDYVQSMRGKKDVTTEQNIDLDIVETTINPMQSDGTGVKAEPIVVSEVVEPLPKPMNSDTGFTPTTTTTTTTTSTSADKISRTPTKKASSQLQKRWEADSSDVYTYSATGTVFM